MLISPHTAYYTDHALSDTVENTLTNCLIRVRADRMDRLKVGILFGGCSEEHPISVKSAQEVAQTPRPREVRTVLRRDHEERRVEALRRP